MAVSDAIDDAELDAGGAWYRAPLQGRSRETLDRLLDALALLLAERDFAEISVADIAASADRTVGAFYGRFDDKDAALFALHMRHLEADRLAASAFLRPDEWSDRSLATTVHDLIEASVPSFRHPRPGFRAALVRSTSMPAFLEQCKLSGQGLGELWSAVVLAHRDEIHHPDPDRIVALVFRQVMCILTQDLLLGCVVPPSYDSDAELVDDLTTVALRMLGAADDRSAPSLPKPRSEPFLAGMRSPQQQRAHETLDRFYGAAEQLLAERSWDEVSVSDIAERADRAVGSFYARFDGKDSLLVAIAARTAESDVEFVTEMLDPVHWNDRPMCEIVRDCLTFQVHTHSAAPLAHRALMMRTMSDPSLGRNRSETHHRVAHLWSALACAHRDEMNVADPERAAVLAFKHLLAVLDVVRLFGPVYPAGPQSDAELATEMSDLACRILGVECGT